MSYYRNRDAVSFDYPPSTVNRANGGFSNTDTEVIGRWVERDESDGTLRLLAANNKPLGVIISLSPTKVGVALGPFVQGKQAGTTALKLMLGVKGATKVVEAGGTAERGFVTEVGAPASNTANDVSDLAVRRGIIVASEDTTANSEGEPTTEVLMY